MNLLEFGVGPIFYYELRPGGQSFEFVSWMGKVSSREVNILYLTGVQGSMN